MYPVTKSWVNIAVCDTDSKGKGLFVIQIETDSDRAA